MLPSKKKTTINESSSEASIAIDGASDGSYNKKVIQRVSELRKDMGMQDTLDSGFDSDEDEALMGSYFKMYLLTALKNMKQ